MWTKSYWKALGEKVLGVAAATLGGLMSADAFNLITANWGDIFSAVGTASSVAFLLSLAAAVTSSNGPDFRSQETEKELAKTV